MGKGVIQVRAVNGSQTSQFLEETMRPEIYTITVRDDHLAFGLREDDLPQALISEKFSTLPPDYAIICRMGDPELLECLVLRHSDLPGGIFILRNGELLFAAVAESNLAYGLGLAYFGQLTANARYGADIYENMDNSDD